MQDKTHEQQAALATMTTHIGSDDPLLAALFAAPDFLCAVLDEAFGATNALTPAQALVVELATLAYDAFVDIEEVRRDRHGAATRH